MFDKRDNYKVSMDLATGGFVLLKNEQQTLPFLPSDTVAVIGDNCTNLIKGGGGSADVTSEYVSSLSQGLLEQQNAGRVRIYEESFTIAENKHTYTVVELNEIAKNCNKVIFTFSRYSAEGRDRAVEEYELSEEEKIFLDNLEKSDIKQAVIILNVASLIDLSFLKEYKTVSAALVIFLPGMEGGRAVAKVLCGEISPSGKLTATVAQKYEYYPASSCFSKEDYVTSYEEGMFVGYRYFETFHPEQVLYPFGFGLSYTNFCYSDFSLKEENDILNISVKITNTGDYAGREVVQLYVTKPKDVLPQCAVELVDYFKTSVLQPNQSEIVTMHILKKELACFDENGDTGFKNCFVLPKGEYLLSIGSNIRERQVCGSFVQTEDTVTEKCVAHFDEQPFEFEIPKEIAFTGDKGVSLYDVESGQSTIEEFIAQLTVEEMAEMTVGQCPRFALGTAGIGDLSHYSVPNPQTADGPAGVRRSIPTTCFPCATLIGCSFDSELQQAMGRAMGIEALECGVDILLAPGLNIQRHVLCGRNFEYYSEDPIVSGKAAANIVKGAKSKGLCTTIKHFVANNREFNRHDNNSIVSERALREVYMKGFRIAIEQGNPAFLMTSYNLLNGEHTCTSAKLIRGVLRSEWGYEGCIMTDWRTHTHIIDEILAGNNIKMPRGYRDDIDYVIKLCKEGELSIGVLQENTCYILKAVMQTNAFKNRYFGIYHTVGERAVIPATKVHGVSTCIVKEDRREDGMEYIYKLGLDPQNQNTYIFYALDVEKSGKYRWELTTANTAPEGYILYTLEDGKELAKLKTQNSDDSWHKMKFTTKLPAGKYCVKITFAVTGELVRPIPENWYLCYTQNESFALGEQVITCIEEE